MAREWREEYNGGIYHVIARGNNNECIFKESMEGIYVLMDNHYYLILQVFDKKLQEMMHQVNNKYSKYFNYKFYLAPYSVYLYLKGLFVNIKNIY